MRDEINDPHEPHSANVEPGRDITRASVEQLIKNLKYFAFLLIPLMGWIARVEGQIQQGDRQTRLMSEQQHTDLVKEIDTKFDALPPELYRDYIDSQFQLLHERLDHIEILMEKN